MSGCAAAHFAAHFKFACRKLREMLVRCAGTALNSKLIGSHKDFFSNMAVKVRDLLLASIAHVCDTGCDVSVRLEGEQRQYRARCQRLSACTALCN